MQSSTRTILAAASVLTLLAAAGAGAQENYASWELLKNPFESTGGGGVMIDGYDPVVAGDKCATNFTATVPGAEKKTYYNKVEFDAVPVQGGILCTNGKWQALDGSASGTTPFRVFIKDNIKRRSP